MPIRPTLAFVSPVGGSAFMAELFDVVADAVRRAGGAASTHEGGLDDLPATLGAGTDAGPGSGGATTDHIVAVVVPHEYATIHGPPPPHLARRTIAFGVEHPGTATFETAAGIAATLAASFEINDASVDEMRRRGVLSERFVVGYSPLWDHRDENDVRDVDWVHLGTADELRLRALAQIAPDLAGRRSEIVLAPHEPMLAGRPDVLVGRDKWRLLARSRILVNLHRERATAFEWVRALEAISNGCAIATEPSVGLAPLVPGQHVLVAHRERLGRVCAAALDDGAMLTDLAAAALAVSRSIDMVAAAGHLLDVAAGILASADPWPASDAGVISRSRSSVAAAPLAQWVPTVGTPGSSEQPNPPASTRDRVGGGTGVTGDATTSTLLTRQQPTPTRVDVVCVATAGDGPWQHSVASLRSVPGVAVHLGLIGPNPLVPVDGGPHLASVRAFPAATERGTARDELVQAGAAPHIFVLDSGDEVLDSAVFEALLVSLLGDGQNPAVDVAYPMAVVGSDMVMNALVPDRRRLERFAYLTRGYAVRRTALARLGGFADVGGSSSAVDHRFWSGVAHAGLPYRLHRTVGVRLWTRPGP